MLRLRVRYVRFMPLLIITGYFNTTGHQEGLYRIVNKSNNVFNQDTYFFRQNTSCTIMLCAILDDRKSSSTQEILVTQGAPPQGRVVWVLVKVTILQCHFAGLHKFDWLIEWINGNDLVYQVLPYQTGGNVQETPRRIHSIQPETNASISWH